VASVPPAKVKTKSMFQLLSALLPIYAGAQGTFVYDQQSSDEPNGGSSANVIQDAQPTGQSFTPSLNGIGFVRLNVFDENRNNGLGATIYVNLRSGSITGPIVDSTAPVTLPDNFGLPLNTGFVTFRFSAEVPLQPGTKYFLQPVVQAGDSWGIFAGTFGYDRGELYAFGSSSPTTDYWFREGVIVPEPSTIELVALCMGIYACRKVRTT